MFAVQCLVIPNNQRQNNLPSLTATVKQNIGTFRSSLGQRVTSSLSPMLPEESRMHLCHTNRNAARVIQAKLEDGDVRGAVRALCSEEGLAPFSPETWEVLQAKHPSLPPVHFGDAPQDQCLSTPEELHSMPPFPVTEREVEQMVRSFPAGSAGGPDLLRPQHLKDMLSHSAGVAGRRLLVSLTGLCSRILSGEVPEDVCPLLFGASLCALNKPQGDIRPIAVGNTIRRLAAKIGCRAITSKLSGLLQPAQLGFGTPRGLEAAAHAARRYVRSNHSSPKVLLKLDFSNAFNSILRDNLLSSVHNRIPELYPYVYQAYHHSAHLWFGDQMLRSSRGVQQGDPMGPALFSLLMHPVTSTCSSELNVWYLDDGTLADSPETVLSDYQELSHQSSQLGLDINKMKCELYFLSMSAEERRAAEELFQKAAPGIESRSLSECSLLGAPLSTEAANDLLDEKTASLEAATDRLLELPTQSAFYLLKNALCMPKLMYVLRCTPTWESRECLERFDCALRVSLSSVLNIHFTDDAWTQASWPVSSGGLGIRRACDLSLPAFLSSAMGSRDQTNALLPLGIGQMRDEDLHTGITMWMETSTKPLPAEEELHVQRSWDRPLIEQAILHATATATFPRDQARLVGVSSGESGAFLRALPSERLGLLMENDAFRVAVGLRIGADICQPHTCPCGSPVDSKGTHGLSCKRSAGRGPRHASVNAVLKRAFSSAGIPCTLEPAHLQMGNNLRPDGVTLVPWAQGKALVWDFTCTDGMASSYVEHSATEPTYAAKIAETNKCAKYAYLTPQFIFAPIAAECLGSFGRESLTLLKQLGRKIAQSTREHRAYDFLMERVSVEIQKGNAQSVRGTLY